MVREAQEDGTVERVVREAGESIAVLPTVMTALADEGVQDDLVGRFVVGIMDGDSGHSTDTGYQKNKRAGRSGSSRGGGRDGRGGSARNRSNRGGQAESKREMTEEAKSETSRNSSQDGHRSNQPKQNSSRVQEIPEFETLEVHARRCTDTLDSHARRHPFPFDHHP